jgi:hypothetical protein
VKLIDKSNGYIFSSIHSSAVEFSKIAAAPLGWDYERYPLLFIHNNLVKTSHLSTIICVLPSLIQKSIIESPVASTGIKYRM